MTASDLARGIETFNRIRRRHPNVGDDNIWILSVDGCEQFIGGAYGGDDLESGVAKQSDQAFANQAAVFRDD